MNDQLTVTSEYLAHESDEETIIAGDFGANTIDASEQLPILFALYRWAPPSPTRQEISSEEEEWERVAQHARVKWLKENPF